MMTALQRTALEREIDLAAWQREPRQKASPVTHKNHAAALSTGVHPIVVAIPLLAAAWFLAVAWAAFAGGESSLVLAVVTFIVAIFFALLVGGAVMARNMVPQSRQTRSLSAFLHGEVEIATGRVSGWEVLAQTAVMSVSIAIGATAIAIIAVAV